ncbi:MAG: hypothetical protein GYA87_08005 [Christensenellaceae bacterium]|nr:hypothetical protein [Christensenellaceae bacterium]
MFTIKDNFMVYVKDIENSIDFYQTKLGLYMYAINEEDGYKVYMKNDKNDNCICLIQSNDLFPGDIYIKSKNIAKSHAIHSDIITELDPKEGHYTFLDLDKNKIHICSDFEHIIMPTIKKEVDTNQDEILDYDDELEEID